MSGQSFSVLNNLSSMKAQKDLYFTNIGLNKTLARLSSGRRIVEAADDAAGLAIASGLRADALALNQAIRNANDGIAIVQIADGALSKMTDLLMRGVTLAEQAASDTVGVDEKETLDVEYKALINEIERIVSVTHYKGTRLFNTGSAVNIGVYVGDTQFTSFITISIGRNDPISQGDCFILGGICVDGGSKKIATQETALDALGLLKSGIASISRWRGALGAQQNRLINAVGIIQTQEVNIRAAESTISDADMAEEIVNMTKYQILMQSGMASLAQANASSQQVLQLLR